MQKKARSERIHRAGVLSAAVGLLLTSAALFFPAEASPPPSPFEGVCVGTMNAGTCTLDEPEGSNTATHGTVAYLRVGDVMTFAISATDSVSDVQICMQTNAPFEQAANSCAGIHGHHVGFGVLGNVYSVDLADEGFDAADPLYWALHVVAGGRTLLVMTVDYVVPTTTTTEPATTTTVPATTTTVLETTTTTEQATTTTTTDPGTTTTTDPGGTTTTLPATTTSSVLGQQLENTTTTIGSQVLGETLARTGGPPGFTLLVGLALILLAAAISAIARYDQPVYPER